ncbi:hypothetical protein LO763_27000 [Glycomyces sp. A-F 0318]|uniref:hypothetical protein n=1 Tax=Glycomyces amatae TaxID=2881355 RepID=UPI001E632465|nr:hypothetical protein [Glycomyces amatae]MCD0447268.1 hypothetical protein [Glycomyces amatae]
MELPGPVAAWARRTDAAEGEWARREVDSWARAAEFSRPLRWGEAEAAVLARDYAPLPGSLVSRTVGVVAWVLIALLAVPLLGAPLIGLVLVALGAAQGSQEAADGWISAATFMFVLGVIAAGTALSLWRERRRRSSIELVMNGVNALASGAAIAVLAVAAVSGGPWLPLLMIAAALLSAVAFVLVLVSKPEGRAKRRKPPRRGPRGSDKRARALKARKRLLEVLVHRGLADLDEGDRIRVAEMPLGYWSELDGLDEREWRRVLERRHVGWRDFGAKD